jgi:hypothetical protein
MLIGTFSAVTFIWCGAIGAVASQNKTGSVSAGNAFVALVFLFNAVFAFGITPLQALYPVEVLSFEIRAKGMAFSNLSLTTAMLINQFAYPIALEKIGWKLYIVFACWCPIQAFVVWMFIPETKVSTSFGTSRGICTNFTCRTAPLRRSTISSIRLTPGTPRLLRRRLLPTLRVTSLRSRRSKPQSLCYDDYTHRCGDGVN